MITYMTFTMDAATITSLLKGEPDYFLFKVGANILANPEKPTEQVAALTLFADAFKNGGEQPIAEAAACPVPPCRPGIE